MSATASSAAAKVSETATTNLKAAGDIQASANLSQAEISSLVPGNLKERLAAVVNQAYKANSDGRYAVNSLNLAANFGESTVNACDLAVKLLDKILEKLDKNSLIFRQLTAVQVGAKTCDKQAHEALKIIAEIKFAASKALISGDEALSELIVIYESLKQPSQPVQSIAAISPNKSSAAIQVKTSHEALKNEAESTAANQAEEPTTADIKQKLATVIAEASVSNMNGRIAVDNLNSASSLGHSSVVACDQAVLLLDKILETLDKKSDIYKQLNDVQTKAKKIDADSHGAILGIDQVTVGAAAALATGNVSLNALTAVYNSLKPELKPKPSMVAFSDLAAAASKGNLVNPGTVVDANLKPTAAPTVS